MYGYLQWIIFKPRGIFWHVCLLCAGEEADSCVFWRDAGAERENVRLNLTKTD